MKILKTIIIKHAVVHVWEDDMGNIILGGLGWYEFFDYENSFEKEGVKEHMRKSLEKEALKALTFVEHIKDHLRDPANIWKFSDDAKVMCRICNKTIDEIVAEEGDSKK